MITAVILILVEWLSIPMLVALVSLLTWRRVFKPFPVFFSYAGVSLMVTLVRLLAYQGKTRTYFYAYWISELALTLFALLATYELFTKRLFPRFYVTDFYRRLFPITAIFIAVMAVLTAIASTKVAVLFIKAIHGLDFVRVAVLFLFIVLMLLMGREWTRYEFGIALGFAVDAAAFLASFAIWTKASPAQRFSDQIPVIAYDIACVIWLITFTKSEKLTAPPSRPPSSELVREAREWEQNLKDSLAGKNRSD